MMKCIVLIHIFETFQGCQKQLLSVSLLMEEKLFQCENVAVRVDISLKLLTVTFLRFGIKDDIANVRSKEEHRG